MPRRRRPKHAPQAPSETVGARTGREPPKAEKENRSRAAGRSVWFIILDRHCGGGYFMMQTKKKMAAETAT